MKLYVHIIKKLLRSMNDGLFGKRKNSWSNKKSKIN